MSITSTTIVAKDHTPDLRGLILEADIFPATADEAAQLVVATTDMDSMAAAARAVWAKLVIECHADEAKIVFSSLFPTFKAEILVTTPGNLENSVEERTELVEISPHEQVFDDLLRGVAASTDNIDDASAWWLEHAKARFDAECAVRSLGGIAEYQNWLQRNGDDVAELEDYLAETDRMSRYVESRLETAIKDLVPLQDNLDHKTVANLMASHSVSLDEIRAAYVRLEAAWEVEKFNIGLAAGKYENSEEGLGAFLDEGLEDLIALDIPQSLTVENDEDPRRDITAYHIATQIKRTALTLRFS